MTDDTRPDSPAGGGAPTPPARIGRLTLHAGPLTEAQARELAEQVAQSLGRLPLRSTESVAVRVPAPASQGVAALRDGIVRALAEALAVTP